MNPLTLKRSLGRLIAAALAITLPPSVAFSAEEAMPDCPGVGRPAALLSNQGVLESIAFDRSGRLLYTDLLGKALKRLDRPGGAASTVATGISGPGGIAVAGDNLAYVGTGNSLNGVLPSLALAGIAQVRLDTGAVTAYAKGLTMANGLVRAADGTFYASNDLAASLDRVLPDGTVQRGWLKQNSNGLALSRDGSTLYVNQFVPAKVLGIDRATGGVTFIAEPPASRKWSLLDGLDIDDQGRLYVVAYLSGEVWRLDRDTGFCLLAKGLTVPSAVAVGRTGAGFSASSIYVTGHGGTLYEVPQAVPAP